VQVTNVKQRRGGWQALEGRPKTHLCTISFRYLSHHTRRVSEDRLTMPRPLSVPLLSLLLSLFAQPLPTSLQGLCRCHQHCYHWLPSSPFTNLHAITIDAIAQASMGWQR
jgi:hypothetical protein